ncbi:DUF3775 domain-containing protein [Novosphingobium panipatense]|jgi:hypothetical protein|uniref:Uncharacterized protein n=3 Tax=Novosphingobium panipatense TaxID=428991 RepID=A0ABY1Q517_9SPHN|nr:DUF3775 domain-containing protein [Novosphingobium panipatense]SMP59701.1 Protein of unknown function [Novosphingobium panipatense]
MPEMGDLLRAGSVTDPFFEVLNDGDWNACIGKQGDEINYVEGYLQAAQLLVDTLLEKEMFGSRDTLAMPILFNARHGLELALKYVLRELVALGMARTREGPIDHDLHAYWVHLSEQRIGDRACREQLAELKPFVESFMKQDIDGQELRYFEHRDGKQSLGEQAVVNLPLIQASVRELRDILDRLMERVARLGQEHVSGTKTAECSRSDLIAIARIVGPKPSWTEEAFLERKADAMAQFGLSSKSFSKALDAIKASRELKNLIEVESDLLHLSEAKILEIVALWLDANPPKPASTPPRVVNAASISFDDVMRYGDKMSTLNKAVMEQLTVEEFADLQTIFYVGRDQRFGEEYPRLLETTLEAHRLAKERYALFHHILSKKNFIDGLAAGLRCIGQPALGKKVAQMRDALRPSE